MIKKSKNISGAATLIYISVIALISVLILTASYSRLLLALKRNTSFADKLVVNYKAESEINDLLIKLLAGYIDIEDLGNYSNEIGDTKIEVETETTDGTETIYVTAARPFAVSKIKAVRQAEEVESVGKIDLMFVLDCTPSMRQPSGSPEKTTRLEEMRRATLNFLDNIAESENKDRFKVGVGVYTYGARWLRTEGGEEVRSDSDLTLEEIRAAVDSNFSLTTPSCMSGATSIGSGLAFANEYFRNNPSVEDAKRVIVLITDGLPNSRIPYANCPVSTFCPWFSDACDDYPEFGRCSGSGSACLDHALDFTKCTLADNQTSWDGGRLGDRDPNVDIYAVTVLADSDDDNYEDTVEAFETYSTQYFNVDNAAELTQILEDIFQTVVSATGSITIEKLIPGVNGD
jgi:hypothetical protein